MGSYQMGIYERDYTVLTKEETGLWEILKQKEVVDKIGDLEIRTSLFREYPRAVRHYMSLFPNHYLDIEDLTNETELSHLSESFLDVITNPTSNERSILTWIRDKKAYFIVASILQYYNFGHHDAFIFPEFRLGSSYQVDFLVVGLNSGGYEFIFVELEAPNGRITTADGNIGDAFRKGMNQVEEWKGWISEYYSSFQETFNKYKHPNIPLPREFMSLDATRLHYAVVAGRRYDFEKQGTNKRTYRIQRRTLEEQKIRLIHYDNLYDTSKAIVGKATY